ncbi:MAG: hypothetical protein K9M98_10770 [Cephaloticoccus sp.]|nr:hypothetical protein [Cephaloticoccus sp.]
MSAGTVAVADLLKRQISFFPCVSRKEQKTLPGFSVSDALEEIKSGKYLADVEAVRNKVWLEDDVAVKALKQKMPAVTWSAKFADRRRKADPHTPTGILALDFDNIGNAETVRDKVGLDRAQVLAVAVTVGGRGLRVLVAVDAEADHTACFVTARDYFKAAHGLEADEACKDITRLGIQSWDEGIIINGGMLNVFTPNDEAEHPTSQHIISVESVESMPSVESMGSMESMYSMSQTVRSDRKEAAKRHKALPKALRHVFDRCLLSRNVIRGQRHQFLTKAVPALYEWASCDVAEELLRLHYDMNQGVWRTARSDHEAEFVKMLHDYAEKFPDQLNASEKAKYLPLDTEEERAAFRISRDLSNSPSGKKCASPGKTDTRRA